MTSRKPQFSLKLEIHEVQNIPLVAGVIFIKWHIIKTSRSECRGKTDRATIRNHKATWDPSYVAQCTFKVSLDKQKRLQESPLILEIFQKIQGSRERMELGKVRINLSEYTAVPQDCRRYLLRESKVNSTVRLTISIQIISGTREFIAPPLNKPAIFHGITGLLSDGYHPNKLESKDCNLVEKNLQCVESDQMQCSELGHDTLQRLFPSRWTSAIGEMCPHDVIEDIFAGGDGWIDQDESPFQRSPEKLNSNATHGRPHSSALYQFQPHPETYDVSMELFRKGTTTFQSKSFVTDDKQIPARKVNDRNANEHTESVGDSWHNIDSDWEDYELALGRRLWQTG